MKAAILAVLALACICATGCATKPSVSVNPLAVALPKPQPTDKNAFGASKYNTYEDYIEALTDWKIHQAGSAQAQPGTIRQLSPLHRFERITGGPIDAGMAVDTVTGQLCRTWNWNFRNKSLSGSVDTLPLCVDIYRQFPAEE